MHQSKLPRRFVKVHNLAQKNQEKVSKNGRRHVLIKVFPKEIEYFNEDKVTFYFFLIFVCLHSFSIPTMHILTFSFAFANMLVKLSFSRKLYN